jgi:hypothetical protein
MHGRAIALLRFSLLLAPLVLPAVSCKSEGGAEGGNALANALLACGLLTAGQLPAEATSTEPFDDCVSRCVAESTCVELEDLFCGTNFEPQAACGSQCIETHGFACADGSKIDPLYACDGLADCDDGSDELYCPPPFVCGDGIELAPVRTCDGEPDCVDESDELGCPAMPTFTCTSGEQLPASWRCNAEEDCADGSDEVGCAMIMCPGSDTSGGR